MLNFSKIKVKDIPLWVSFFAIIMFVLGCFLGISGLLGLDPNPLSNPPLGGRGLGLALIVGLAVWFKNPTIYLVAFIGGIARDVGDLIGEFGKATPDVGIIIGIVMFLFIGLVATYHANNARKLNA